MSSGEISGELLGNRGCIAERGRVYRWREFVGEELWWVQGRSGWPYQVGKGKIRASPR